MRDIWLFEHSCSAQGQPELSHWYFVGLGFFESNDYTIVLFAGSTRTCGKCKRSDARSSGRAAANARLSAIPRPSVIYRRASLPASPARKPARNGDIQPCSWILHSPHVYCITSSNRQPKIVDNQISRSPARHTRLEPPPRRNENGRSIEYRTLLFQSTATVRTHWYTNTAL